MEHYDFLTIVGSIFIGVIALWFIWLTVKIAEKIVRARGRAVNLKPSYRKPFHAILPAISNGWANVLDADGNEWCTCYAKGFDKAKTIAAALNAHLPEGD
jgi:hypothetical protein